MLPFSLGLTMLALLLVSSSFQEDGLEGAHRLAVLAAALAGLGQGLLLLELTWPAVAAIWLCSLTAFRAVLTARWTPSHSPW